MGQRRAAHGSAGPAGDGGPRRLAKHARRATSSRAAWNAAKLEIRDLTQKLHGDELGVVLFSGASFVQVPLTSDYTTALNFLENAGPSLISRSGTVIGDAIRMADQAFDPKLASQKVLILMTDGEDVESNPVEAAKAAAANGMMIYTIGFGTAEGQPVPETDRTGQVLGYKTDANGQTVISKMDESTLQQIADAGHGQYFHATPDGSELTSLLSQIDGLQKAQLQGHDASRPIERFQIFLVLAFVALGWPVDPRSDQPAGGAGVELQRVRPAVSE